MRSSFVQDVLCDMLCMVMQAEVTNAIFVIRFLHVKKICLMPIEHQYECG